MTGARSRITPLLTATLVVLAASVIGQVVGASQNSTGLNVFAAVAFGGALLRVGWQLNRPWWQTGHGASIGPSTSQSLPSMAARNGLLVALGYAWGGLSLLAVYLLSGLAWRHGWQYGSGMLVIAFLIMFAVRDLEAAWKPGSATALKWVTLVHGWAALAGLGWLIGFGKIWSLKDDWAANVVFACGALIIAGLGAMALKTARHLEQQTSPLA